MVPPFQGLDLFWVGVSQGVALGCHVPGLQPAHWSGAHNNRRVILFIFAPVAHPIAPHAGARHLERLRPRRKQARGMKIASASLRFILETPACHPLPHSCGLIFSHCREAGNQHVLLFASQFMVSRALCNSCLGSGANPFRVGDSSVWLTQASFLFPLDLFTELEPDDGSAAVPAAGSGGVSPPVRETGTGTVPEPAGGTPALRGSSKVRASLPSVSEPLTTSTERVAATPNLPAFNFIPKHFKAVLSDCSNPFRVDGSFGADYPA